MKYGLLVSDLDGTLLREDKTASHATVAAIKKYRRMGGKFVISTGRMFESVINNASTLGLSGINMPVCALDGAVIKESVTKKLISLNRMPCDEVYDFALECERIGCYFQIYTEDELLVAEDNEINRRYCAVSKIGKRVVGKLSEYILANSPACTKVLISSDNIGRYYEHFSTRYNGINFVQSLSTFLDGISVNAGKGNAIDVLRKYYGVSDVAAVGDSMNDISMIERATLGIAVNNADIRLKNAANIIAPSCNDDGVARIIDWIISDKL